MQILRFSIAELPLMISVMVNESLVVVGRHRRTPREIGEKLLDGIILVISNAFY